MRPIWGIHSFTTALTIVLPKQPKWSESKFSYKRNIDDQVFAPRPLGWGFTSVDRPGALEAIRISSGM